MGFKWDIATYTDFIENGDWGHDIVSAGVDLKQIVMFNTKLPSGETVTVYPHSCVIIIDDNPPIYVGYNIGGYGYNLLDSKRTLVKMAPFTTAVLSFNAKFAEDLEHHLYLKHIVTHYLDKHTQKYVELDTPIEKETLIYFKDRGVIVC